LLLVDGPITIAGRARIQESTSISSTSMVNIFSSFSRQIASAQS
jgi:hypothetical protein